MIDNSPYEIRRQIGEAAALEQLAEECAELGKAALKLARIARRETPTPVSHEEAHAAFMEELGDVRVCLRVLKTLYGPLDTAPTEEEKIRRWYNRLREFKQGGNGKLHNGGEEA